MISSPIIRFGLVPLIFAALPSCAGRVAVGLPINPMQNQEYRLQKPSIYNRDLLYVTAPPETGYIYSYPQGRLRIAFGIVGGSECSDDKGNVYISVNGGLAEFPHDGASQVALLIAAGGIEACSFDHTNGNLAAATELGVYVYHYSPRHGWLLPVLRSPPFEPAACGYDGSGNLFVDGKNSSGAFQFAELPAGSKTFVPIALDQQIQIAGQVQWDGQNIVVEDLKGSPSVLYRFSINGSAGSLAGTTVLKTRGKVLQYWIQGSRVIGSVFKRHKFERSRVVIWPYPAGNQPTKKLPVQEAFGVTVSVPPGR